MVTAARKCWFIRRFQTVSVRIRRIQLAGQMSLFDLVSEEDKKEFEIRMPDVEEFGKEELLGYEKEVLGIYLSGHPLENYRGMMEKTISAKTSRFSAG